MATPRRPARPGRPNSASARRRPPQQEIPEGEEGEFEDEAPPPPQGPSVTMIVGLGAGLLFAILLAVLAFSKRGYLVEVENMSEGMLLDVHVKINGTDYSIGEMRPNSIEGSRADCTPGNDVEVSYTIPNRGKMTRKLPKKDTEGGAPAPEFNDYKGVFRIRLQPEGISETLY